MQSPRLSVRAKVSIGSECNVSSPKDNVSFFGHNLGLYRYLLNSNLEYAIRTVGNQVYFEGALGLKIDL